jgi:hypothetical protein
MNASNFKFFINTFFRKTIPIPSNIIRYRIKYYQNKYPKVLSLDETFNLVLSGFSISRFGDGELNIVFGRGISFQSYSQELCDKLKIILRIGFNEKLKFVCGIQRLKFGGVFWRKYWFFHIRQIIQLLNYDTSYGDLGFSRHINDYNFYRFKQYISDKRILIIYGSTKLNMSSELFENTEYYLIKSKPKNAYSEYQNILQSMEEIIHQKQINLILISLGPTASVLAYEACFQFHIQSLDIGHLTNTFDLQKKGIQFEEGFLN